MKLGEVMASQDLFGRAPWCDQARAFTMSSTAEGAQERRYQAQRAAADELRGLLADHQWHTTEEVKGIARKHGVSYKSTIDRAGGYQWQQKVISAKAEL